MSVFPLVNGITETEGALGEVSGSCQESVGNCEAVHGLMAWQLSVSRCCELFACSGKHIWLQSL